MSKFVCPECGGSLKFYCTAETTRAIDPKTGVVNKTANIEELPEIGASGVSCAECHWLHCTLDEELPDNLAPLNQKIGRIKPFFNVQVKPSSKK